MDSQHQFDYDQKHWQKQQRSTKIQVTGLSASELSCEEPHNSIFIDVQRDAKKKGVHPLVHLRRLEEEELHQGWREMMEMTTETDMFQTSQTITPIKRSTIGDYLFYF